MSNEVPVNQQPVEIVKAPSRLPIIVVSIIAVLLAGAAIAGFGLYYSANQELKATQAELAKPISIDDISHEDGVTLGGNSLARVAANLPQDANVKRVLFLSNGKYLVMTENVKTNARTQENDPAIKLEMTVWLADIQENTLSQLVVRDIDDLATYINLSSHVHAAHSRPLVELRTIKEDEGVQEWVIDYFVRETGALRLTQSYNLFEESIVLERGDKKLEIALAPKDGCKSAAADVQVQVTGVLLNGTLMPFVEPQNVFCSINELYGRGFYPELSETSYSGYRDFNGRDSVYMRLPLGGIHLDIDVDSLEPSGVKMSVE